MKFYSIFVLLLYTINCSSQWTYSFIPEITRFDDIFFINDSVGWVAGGSSGAIYKTTNGGLTWNLQFRSNKYLRSIVFATPNLGFCGSLESSFYKTEDGGMTWGDIANSINPKPPGICGLSAPSPNAIYGCGIWSSPAYIIKSTDEGQTWTTINLTSFASALVDIHFISADTGFVAGKANPETDGGIILYTSDGGDTWEVIHKTMIDQDYIWKLQTPDGINYYGSIQSLPTTNNVRILKSQDGGMTWETHVIKNSYSYMQTIGFLDTLIGWTGGGTTLFETLDGGLSWNNIAVGLRYNRFLKMNDSTAFLSGEQIYSYKKGNTTSTFETNINDDIHYLKVSPNPTANFINIELTILNKTRCKLQLISSEGKRMQSIYDGILDIGDHSFNASLEGFPPQIIYLILHTNEGLVYKKIIKS